MARAMKDSGVYWVATIPESWHVAQLKRYASVNNGQEIGLEIDKNDNAIPVYGSGGVFKFTDTYMFNGKAVMFGRKGTLGKPIYVSGKFWTVDTMYYLTYSDKLDAKFNFYQLLAFDWIPHITQTALPSIVGSEIAACKFAFPPVQEQSRIVSFLDSACARIDTVMEQTRASIEEYKKLKQSVITQAVTKGIRPNRPMKDSGIDWIGQIPAEWEHRKLKSFISMPVIDGPHESPELFDTGIPYISATAIENGKINFALMRGFISEQYCDECDKRYKPIRNDILVIKLGASTGQVAIVETDDRFNIWVPLAAVRCNKRVIPQYIYFCFQSEYLLRQMELSWTFGTQQTLGVKTIEQLKFLIPCLDEQKEITDYLDEKCKKIDSLISKKEQFLSEMVSYKKSLIFEYVTGKKEVV